MPGVSPARSVGRRDVAGLEAVGFEDVSVRFTDEVVDGIDGAIVQVTGRFWVMLEVSREDAGRPAFGHWPCWRWSIVGLSEAQGLESQTVNEFWLAACE